MSTDDQDKPPSPDAVESDGGRPQATIEQSLRDEVDRLIREAQEKKQILQDRNEELVRVKAELDQLHERVNQLESSRSGAMSELRDDSERMRTEFQAQLALLQAELSQREWTIEERQAEARLQEQKFRQEIDSLRGQVAASKAAGQHDDDAFVFGEPRASEAQAQHIERSSKADHSVGYTGSFARQRRWQSGFAAKRRWRS
jgi:chromosome segregation ATPase